MCAVKCVSKQAYFAPDIIETDGSGALHTHVQAMLMPAYCIALCVCVLLRVCSSLHVCAVAVCYSPQRPGLALRPLMASERGVPASRQRALTHVGSPQTRHKRGNCTLCLMAFIYKRFQLNSKVIQHVTHCCFYCLIKDIYSFFISKLYSKSSFCYSGTNL